MAVNINIPKPTYTKNDIGLGNVDNTSDLNKPISTATQTALNGKQNTLGFTPENVANKSTDVNADQASSTKYPSVKSVFDWAVNLLSGKVDKVTGKGLSENDFTNTLKTKLDGIQVGAEVNVNADWDATSGDAQILNKPTIPSIGGLVPYTGATADVDLGNNDLNAEGIKIKGTGGNGHLNLKHQSSGATAGGSESVIYADASGNPKWKNDGNAVQDVLLSGTTTASISDSTNKRYVTDAQLAVLGNTSGTNTGDQTLKHIIVTSGTSFTTPSNITTSTQFNITLIGGGGGGAGISTATQSASGGGSAGTAIVFVSGLSPSTTYTCAIGVGGAGGASASNGTNGGNTTLTIGTTTYTANGGGGGITGAGANGGAGGTTVNATIAIDGQSGDNSPTLASAAAISGAGGSTKYGLGGSCVQNNQNGKNATGYGAGGSGGKGTSSTGGNGSNGIIIATFV